MTNVYLTPEKVETRTRLFEIGVEALQNEGWTVERVPKGGKASLRRITRGKDTRLVSIRTTQDTWIAFPRDKADTEWVTLSQVDLVTAVSVDDKDKPRFANVHLLDGDEMRARFDRAYDARKQAGHRIPVGRGVWVSLYETEGNDPVTHVGAGAGLESPPIAKVPIETPNAPEEPEMTGIQVPLGHDQGSGERLTIPEAKRRLAISYGVEPANVRIIIEA